MRGGKIVTILSLGVTIGFAIGLIVSLEHIIANHYIRHGMFRLAALSVQRSWNRWMLLALAVSAALCVLIPFCALLGRAVWRLLLSRAIDVRVGIRDESTLKALLVCAACGIWLVAGGWAINHYWLPGKFRPASLAGDMVIIVFTVFLGWGLVKVKWRQLAAAAAKVPMRRLVPIPIICALLVNLGVVIDSKITVPDGPNVVWFLIDALRADHLGCYGYERDTSPRIDEFAAESILFEHAFSQESYTQASVPSYFTSTYPPVHKVLYDHPTVDVLDSRFVTSAEVLRNANYATAAFVFNPHLKARFNFGQGFDLYDDNKEGFDYSLPFHETFETARRIFEKVERYLRKNERRPVFLYLHYRDVHHPYAPPPPYHTLFLPPDVEPVVDIIDKENIPLRREYVDVFISQYDAEIRYTDDYIDKTLRMLEEHGINRDNSIIIITADHGEEFLDYHPDDPGGWRHGRTLYAELINVPLIISIPGLNGEKTVIDSHVELDDIVPTVLDAANMPWEHYGQFQGRNLLPLIRGEDSGSRIVFSGGNFGRGTIIDGEFKYHVYDKFCKERRLQGVGRPPCDYDYRWSEELYDIGADPKETRNVLNERKSVTERLKRVLANVQKSGLDQAEGRAVRLDDTTKAQLKALGYLK